jgi:hypothetical protein
VAVKHSLLAHTIDDEVSLWEAVIDYQLLGGDSTQIGKIYAVTIHRWNQPIEEDLLKAIAERYTNEDWEHAHFVPEPDTIHQHAGVLYKYTIYLEGK